VKQDRYDAVVIGGGFFGCILALFLKSRGGDVLVVEREADLLRRASYANQARVHNGFHYPRSLLTALRSRVNFPRFAAEFRDCVDDSFVKYYGVARNLSKVSARQYRLFMERIGAPIRPAPPQVQRLFNPDMIEAVFEVVEYAFDADRLRARMRASLEEAGVEVALAASAATVGPAAGDGRVTLTVQNGSAAPRPLDAALVLNCTYGHLNQLLRDSGLPLLDLKHEITEMALVEVPPPLKGLGVTTMCGPFFSTMPFPARGLHSLSHVRYTPHGSWRDTVNGYRDAYRTLDDYPKVSRFSHMVHDARRYLPALAEARYVESIWEIKTTLPTSEMNDGRPILFHPQPGLPQLVHVMGGKIDNIYDIEEELREHLRASRS
jgi:glycine/D-amino acid oxidase-like deaminating enzyme